MYTSLILNILILITIIPLSFDKKVKFYSHIEDVIITILFGSFFMLLLEIFFMRRGISGFIPDYIIKTNFFYLPIEKVLFFITIPYSCIFIYEYIRTKFKKDFLLPYVKKINMLVIFILTFLLLFSFYKEYPFTILALSDIFIYLYFINKLNNNYMGYFYLSYLVTLIPYLISNTLVNNGLWFISKSPIIWYNKDKISDLKIFNIPLENTVYFMFFLLTYISIYEFSKSKKMNPKA